MVQSYFSYDSKSYFKHIPYKLFSNSELVINKINRNPLLRRDAGIDPDSQDRWGGLFQLPTLQTISESSISDGLFLSFKLKF